MFMSSKGCCMKKKNSWWLVFHHYAIPSTKKLVETEDLRCLLAYHTKFMQSNQVMDCKFDKNSLPFTSHSNIQPTIRLFSWVKIPNLEVNKFPGPGVLWLGIMRQSANQRIFVVPRWNLRWRKHYIFGTVFQNAT